MPTSTLKAAEIILDIEEVKKNAFDSIAHLQKQQQRISLFKADLDLLLQRYKSYKSLIGKIADWYQEQSLWRQAILGVLALAAATLVGVLVSMLVTYTLLLMGGVAVYLLKDHYDTEQQRAEAFCNDVLKMEEDLAQSVKSLNEIEDRLLNMFQLLAKKSEEYAASIEDLKEKIQYLQEQIEFFDKTLKKLQEINEFILADTKEVHTSGKLIREQLSHLYRKFANLEVEDEAYSRLQRIQTLLQEGENSLEQLIDQVRGELLTAEVGEQEKLSSDNQEAIAQTKKVIDKNQAILDTLLKGEIETEAKKLTGGRDRLFSEKPVLHAEQKIDTNCTI
ncbi:hypothetical protein [Legionella cardiaca]|uniref:Microtubule binding protein n=1 Tax=Legionella cardiaca TaxID=1071983 RepID=A0ABY8AV57_9GAMM|nr:hypothetical protein [Legionella cardiaca]WED44582.1 hypothetical protein PXX05_07280 [Legionella cardiaca]